MTSEIINQSAVLRGQQKFEEAIELIESNIGTIEAESKVAAWLEAFYAARESGDLVKAQKFAKIVAEEYPDMPSVKDYLPKT